LSRRLYAYAFAEEFVLLYPVYAVLFEQHGLSAAQISSLFAIWSLTSFIVEIPSGMWADVFSRRKLLVLGPFMTGIGYGLWTLFPSYPAFAAGFVLWGAGGALRSGTREALVYEELVRVGASDKYPKLIGRATAVGTTASMVSSVFTAPVLAAGGYLAVGMASVAACWICALLGWFMPESRGGDDDEEDDGSYFGVLRAGVAEVRRAPGVPRILLVISALAGLATFDEYLPLLAEATGVAAPVVPLLVVVVMAGITAGGWLAGYGARFLAPLLVIAAATLAGGSLWAHPLGMVLVAVAFGIVYWAMAVLEGGLQDRISDRSRATVTSMAGFGSEVFAILTFAAYALGSTWSGPGPIFAVAAAGYLVMAWLVRRG
jgi:MFS family permease